ncbi:efflux RND transporter permease subunit [Stieleria tagensis]|uniref:efflux RND transporter permease subunit n=1 Tax=Stieleria tagensis TaxID=2956795 RepID=UPI00209BB86C|nr:MMPL family transporter [Stieleria tagensis]
MIEYAIRGRWGWMVLGIVLLAAAYPLSTRLETEQSIASLFGDDDPTLVQYQNLKHWFGKDDVLVLMYHDPDLATDQGIDRSRILTEKIREIEGVTATLSPWVLNDAAESISSVKLPFGIGGQSTPNATPRLMRRKDPVGKRLSDIFSGYTHSSDYTHAAVVTMIDDQQAAQTVDRLKQVAAWWGEQPAVSGVSLVGEPLLVDEAFALVRRDGARLAMTTVALLSLVLMVVLFDLRLVMLLAVVIGWSVVMTKATMFVAGISLSLIASILTAIVTVVSVTAVLHVGVRYHSRRGRGFCKLESMSEVMQRMAAPIFWTCATDAAGFAALWFSQILPVRQFGLMVALSAANVFLGFLLFAPACLMLPGEGFSQRIGPYRDRLTRSLRRFCVRLASGFVRRPALTVACAAIAMIVAVAVVTRSETETSFLRNFRDDSTIVIDYGSVEQNLGGAGVWDLVIDVPSPLSNSFLNDVMQLEKQLLEELGGPAGLSKAISIADATEVLGRTGAGKWMPAPLRIAAMRTRLPSFIGALISEPSATTPDRVKLRIMLRSGEGLSAATKRNLIAGVQRIATERVAAWDAAAANSQISEPVTVTGYYVIMTRLVDQLVADQWRCFAASAILIWLLMWLATGSLRLATAALVPNLLPAFLVLAAVSSLGGRINMGAAMIAAVSVGLSIDGSVHLLSAYLRRRKRGRDVVSASVSAAGSIGAPVMLATVALVVGFSVLSTSEFIPTATFGTLVAWTLVIGTLVNLSVLPALIVTLDSDRSRHRQ